MIETAFAKKGEVKKIYAHYANTEKSSYSSNGHTHMWGEGKNLVIDGFEYNKKRYEYTTLADRVIIRRSDNKYASGNTCGLFVQKKDNRNSNHYSYQSSYPQDCNMASVMGGRIINIGALDLFKNKDNGSPSEKNIERVDFITNNGITAPTNSTDLPKAGHVVTEKSGNNPIQIAAILKLDEQGNPSQYGQLVKILGGTHTYGHTQIYLPDNSQIKNMQLAFLNKDKKGNDDYPHKTGSSTESLGMSFVSLEDLEIQAGQKYYGFSYFGRDVTNRHNLVDYDTFPKDTKGDTADPYGGVAGYFVDEEIIEVPPGKPFECETTGTVISYVTSGNAQIGDSYLKSISLLDGSPNSEKTLDAPTIGVNSIGYNIKDNYIWGYNIPERKIIRIDVDNNIRYYEMDNVPDINGHYYNSADVSHDGILYMKSDTKSKRLDRVKLEDKNTLNVLESITLDKDLNTADFAFNPIDKKIYFIDYIDGYLKKIDIEGNNGTINKISHVGKVYTVISTFDKVGNFYYNSGENINKITFKANGQVNKIKKEFSKVTGLTQGDGARCVNAEVEPSVNLVAEYRFDECSWEKNAEGEVKDSSENNFHIKALKESQTSKDSTISRAAHFKQDDSLIGALNYDFNNSITLTAWFKVSKDQGKYSRIVELKDNQSGSTGRGTAIAYDASGKTIRAWTANADSKRSSEVKYNLAKNNFHDEKWHFVSYVYNNGVAKLYIDAELVDTKDKDITKISAPTKIEIGTSKYEGGVDEVKVFGNAFTDNQISIIYQNELQKLNSDGSERDVQACLISEYRFDACEYYGVENEIVDSVGDNHGIPSNTYSNADGKVKRAAQFNESEIRVKPNFSLGSEPFSISFWMNPKNFPTSRYMSVLSKEIEIYLREDKKLSVNLKNGLDDLVSKADINLDQWTHVFLSNDSNEVKLYINGDETATINAIDIGEHGGNELIIGKTAWDEAQSYDGSIDELKIFDGVLTQEALQTIISYSGSDREGTICLTSIGCKEEAIVIDDTKYVHEIDLATGESKTYTMNNEQIGGASINGFGYNLKDGYFWGSHQGQGAYLVRVGKDENNIYSQEKVGPIEGLPTNKSTYIGDIDNNGYLYLYYKNTPKSGMHTMFIVNLDKNSTDYEYAKVIDSFTLDNIAIADMAFNPIDSQLYAIESDNDFYKIDIIKKEVRVLKEDVIDLTTGTYGTSFFDSSGFFYAIKNSSRDVIRVMFREDENGTFVKASPFSSLINENAQKTNIDGGRCNLYPILIDYGDAPDSYKTSLDEDGARHKITIDEPLVFLGDGVDNEPDAWIPDGDRDDGLVGGFGKLYTSNENFSVTLKVKNNTENIAKVAGWIDFNGNGKFEEKEGVLSIVNPKTEKEVLLEWIVPNDIQVGNTYARFRVTTDALTIQEEHTFGVKGDGEVEDYMIKIKQGNIYDAWDIDVGSIENPVIQTKVVNQTIILKTVALDRNRLTPIDHAFQEVQAGLFVKNGDMISSYHDINTSNPYDTLYFDDINGSHKYVYVKFKYKDDLNITHELNATDPFAIRPKNYILNIDKSSTQAYFRSGQDFNVTIKVKDINNNFINSYDENASVYKIDYNETKEDMNCSRGLLDFNLSDFSHGQANFNAQYSEVGELNIKVSEVEGEEFAIIDKDDGSNEFRFIEAATTFDRIHPAALNALYTYKTINDKDYTYYSNNPLEMGADLDLNVTVVNEQNQSLANFTDGCYSDDITIQIEHNQDDVSDLIFYDSDGNNTNITILPREIAYKIDKHNFLNAQASKTLKMNVQRSITTAKAPIRFTFEDTQTSIVPSQIVNSGTLNKTIPFIYARAHAPIQQNIVGKTMDAIVQYEVYLPTGVDKLLYGFQSLKASEDGVDWYILPDDSSFGYQDPYNRFVGVTVGAYDRNIIRLSATKIPHNNRIVYTPKKYLLYNRWNASAAIHSFQVHFFNETAKWAGKGQQGLTIEQEASNRGIMKMDW